MRSEILTARAEIDAPVEAAQAWFMSLREHPERYEFETHAGFEFEEGSFGEVGARFRTREKFLFLKLDLPFELAEVGETAFWFWLRRPSCLRVWGRFDIEAGSDTQTVLALSVGSETRLGQLMLRFYPVAAAVEAQIRGEVRHIKQSMEHVSAGQPVGA